MSDLEKSGGADLRFDGHGKPYWRLWGAGWKDGESLDPGMEVSLSPEAFPPGTRIVILEPPPGDSRADNFYRELLRDMASGERKDADETVIKRHKERLAHEAKTRHLE